MKSIEEFLTRRESPHSPAFTFRPNVRRSPLSEEVRQSANRGWHIFPATQLAKLTSNPDLLIGEATCDISRLEELAAEYKPIGWRIAIGPSALCVLQLLGNEGRSSFAVLIQDHGECLTTLQAHVGGTAAWAFFRWPGGLALRNSAKRLATGVRVLGDGDSCVLPQTFTNPWADVEAVPCWLRELAFETPDTPPGKAAPVPAFSPRPACCRSRAQFPKHPQDASKGYPVWRGAYRISSRR